MKKRCECCDKVLKDCGGGRKYCNNCSLFTAKLRRQLTGARKRICQLELMLYGSTDTREERWKS